jgi:phage N-6-adenine-methyltransferase
MGQRTMPAQRRGLSKQDVGTPDDFLAAAKRKLGIFAFGLDIAASARNAVAKRYYTKAQDCFKQPSWKSPGKQWSFLNPEFDSIAPYAERCLRERDDNGARIALLVPASVGANWWSDYVHRKALVLLLNGRITFVGQRDPYPKDCALILYSPDLVSGYDVWRWK